MKEFNLKEFILDVTSKASIAVFGFFAPVVPLLLGVGVAIFIDTLFGIWAVKKTEPELFNSRALRKGLVTKLFFYQTVVIGIFIIDSLILHEFSSMFSELPLLITKLVAIALVLIEGVSIDEKFKKVHNKSIIQGIKDFINSYNTIKKDLK